MALPKPRVNPALFFLIPALTLIAIFYVVPLFLSIYISFTPLKNWNIQKYLGEVTTYNYERLIHMIRYDPDFGMVVKTTLFFVPVTLLINVLGGLALALATFLMEEAVSLPTRVLWILPRMTPVAVYSLMWYYFFLGDASGTLNNLLMRLGIIDQPVNWGNDPNLLPYSAWTILVIVNALVGVSFGMVVFYSALRSIPREHIIAARIDGASTWQLVRHILIPQLRWHLIYVTVWQLLSLLTTYTHIFLLVKWGAVHKYWGSTWALYVFNKAFEAEWGSEQGLAAAAATILVIIGSVLGLIALRILGYGKMMGEPRGEL
ncbi:carbohydrate ABC transporter permease [Hyperthermus butylicus]|uniref:ABC-type sugar transport system n=1 Tax=Hyperthermus butylicus (strain DSM 5456 / JCM 9403 / PLM1-5) TaxID=415426 RepID=A2BMS7_HYPBU|nr:sugar ABC transporter permease [Hyperthermus butylicus]ABM81288.1 ABC-type sugar transport system [Hyperthermus butylicus DSM 5456]